MPLAYCKQIQFFYNGHRFGTSEFKTTVVAKEVYVLFLIVFGLTVAMGAMFGVVFSLLSPTLAAFGGLFVYLMGFVVFTVRSTNLRYNGLSLDSNGFTAAFEYGSYAVLFITNTLGILLTLGLFTPWAKVRAAQYKARHIGYLAATDSDAFITAQQNERQALGDEFAEMFDWDFGF